MRQRIDCLPTVLTSFGYRPEYVAELEGLLPTVRAHHPEWPIVVGRGPLTGFDVPTLEVDAPGGKCCWTLPFPLGLNDSENDFRKICDLKAWWMAQVWHNFGRLADPAINRILWIDADARLNGPLDIEMDSEAEVVAGPWCYYDEERPNYEYMCGGLLLFQGTNHGSVERIVDRWWGACSEHIQRLPDSTDFRVDSDQELLTEVLISAQAAGADYVLLKLDHDKYNACPTEGNKLARRGIVDQWNIGHVKMRLPENRGRDWPPAEGYRMQAPIGTPVPERNLDSKVAVWSIGIYAGQTPLDLQPAAGVINPVLTADAVSDIPAEFVADPFMVGGEDAWYMFFEVMNAETGKGEIGLATSKDGLVWAYQQIVLREPFHLSYPHVFSFEGEYYMIPETYQTNSVRLYRADPFPNRWSFVQEIMQGEWVDSSVFFFKDRWWLFTSPLYPENATLYLFHSDKIGGPWEGHRLNPIIERNVRKARPAGRVVVLENTVLRFTQECVPCYGSRVRAFEISGLTEFNYNEREADQSPVLFPGHETWRESGMHHVDAHLVDGRWLACVDGWRHETRKRPRERPPLK